MASSSSSTKSVIISNEGRLYESWAQRLAMEGLPANLIDLVRQAEFEAWVQLEHHKRGTGLFYSEEFRDLPPRFKKKILQIAYEISKEYCNTDDFLLRVTDGAEDPSDYIKDLLDKDSHVSDNKSLVKTGKNRNYQKDCYSNNRLEKCSQSSISYSNESYSSIKDNSSRTERKSTYKTNSDSSFEIPQSDSFDKKEDKSVVKEKLSNKRIKTVSNDREEVRQKCSSGFHSHLNVNKDDKTSWCTSGPQRKNWYQKQKSDHTNASSESLRSSSFHKGDQSSKNSNYQTKHFSGNDYKKSRQRRVSNSSDSYSNSNNYYKKNNSLDNFETRTKDKYPTKNRDSSFETPKFDKKSNLKNNKGNSSAHASSVQTKTNYKGGKNHYENTITLPSVEKIQQKDSSHRVCLQKPQSRPKDKVALQENDFEQFLEDVGKNEVNVTSYKLKQPLQSCLDVVIADKSKDILFWKQGLASLIGHDMFKLKFFESKHTLRLIFDNPDAGDQAIADIETKKLYSDLPIMKVLTSNTNHYPTLADDDNHDPASASYTMFVEKHNAKIRVLDTDFQILQKGGSENKDILDITREKIVCLNKMLNVFRNFYKNVLKEVNSLSFKSRERSKLLKLFSQECNCFDACLPIYSMKEDILKKIKDEKVTIVIANTGSGKSTQLVQYLYRAGYADDDDRIIICTQPRKVAAISVCQHICNQMGSSVGEIVGYDVGLKKKLSRSTKILFMTDAVLLRKFCNPNYIEKIACIIIDEAHERSLHTDLLLGMIKKMMSRNDKKNEAELDLKVVITSATINWEVFVKFFNASCTDVLNIPGKPYPVKVTYENVNAYLGWNYVDACVQKAYELHYNLNYCNAAILVFLTSPLETEEAAQKFQVLQQTKKASLNAIVLCLHGKLDTGEQLKIFQPAPASSRKIIFATNSAETSLTIPDIKFVIDSGMTKQMQYDKENKRSTLLVNFVSQSSADQRKGRAGRTQPGDCFRMYSEEIYDNMEEFSEPEILRMPLQMALLTILDLGIQPDDFDFVNPISNSSIKDAMYSLKHLGAVKSNHLSELGKKIAKLPVNPQLAKLIIEGIDAGIGYETIIISALTKVSSKVFNRTEENKVESDKAKLKFCNVNGDLYTLLSVYHEWVNLEDDYQRLKWCDNNFINNKALEIARQIILEIMTVISDMKSMPDVSKCFKSAEIFHRNFEPLLFECFSENLFVLSGEDHLGYLSPIFDGSFYIHPSSSLSYLHEKQVQFLISVSVLKTSRNFLIDVTPISEKTIVNGYQNDKFEFPLDILQSLKAVATVIKPIGEVCLVQHVLGKDGSIMRNIEKQIICACNTNTFHIEVVVKKGEIIVHSDQQSSKIIASIMREVIDKGRKILSLEEKNYTNLQHFNYVLGCGGLVHDVIFPGESREVVIQQIGKHFNVRDILRKLKCYGTIVHHAMTNDSSLSVTFKTVASAECVLNYFGQNCTGVNVIRGEVPFLVARNKGCLFELQIEWPRLQCDGSVTIKFCDNMTLIEASYEFTKRPLFIGENYIIVEPVKGKDDELMLRNLPKQSDESQIEEEIRCYLPQHMGVRTIVMNRELPHYSSQKEIELQSYKLQEVMSRYSSPNNMLITVQPPAKYDIYWSAIISYDNIDDVEIVKKKIKNGIKLGNYQAKVSQVSKTSLYCNRNIYKVIEKSIKDCETKYRKLDSSTQISVIQQPRYFIINASCDDAKYFSELRSELIFLFQGKHILCSLYPKLMRLFSQRTLISFDEIETSTHTVIRCDTLNKIITIYGSEKNIEQAKQHLTNMNLVSNIKKIKTFDLNNKDIPRGFTKRLYQLYDFDLSKLIKNYDLQIAYFDLEKHQLVLGGLLNNINRAEDHLEELCASLFEEASSCKDEKPNTKEVDPCPICLDQPTYEKSIRLETCGHSICKLCLELQLKSKVFPVVCSKENCGLPLYIEDFRKVFLTNVEMRQPFGESALQYYLTQSIRAIRNCPVPNCSMIYRVGQKALTCQSCQNTICTHCHCLFHYGMSCEMFQNMCMDEDYPLKIWQSKDPANRKSCSTCKTALEKQGGCSHVTCTVCNSHMCWKCLAVFEEPKQVYKHIEDCPA